MSHLGPTYLGAHKGARRSCGFQRFSRSHAEGLSGKERVAIRGSEKAAADDELDAVTDTTTGLGWNARTLCRDHNAVS